MVYSQEAEGVTATLSAFTKIIPWFNIILGLAVCLFAFSTMISWSYYGYQAWAYLLGRGKRIEYIYKAIFCLFVIVGSASSLQSVFDFSDAMIFAMLFPNMIGLVILAPRVREELNKYLSAIRAAGK
jgi:AGCS family alanine or glycine:cation symporter